jgi:hypothetical protein
VTSSDKTVKFADQVNIGKVNITARIDRQQSTGIVDSGSNVDVIHKDTAAQLDRLGLAEYENNNENKEMTCSHV